MMKPTMRTIRMRRVKEILALRFLILGCFGGDE